MESQAATYLFQQGVAVVVCVAVAGGFAWAIVKLFREAKEERTQAAAALEAAHVAARDERAQDRAQYLAAFEAQGKHLDELAGAVRDNTRATDRLADRVTPGIGRVA